MSEERSEHWESIYRENAPGEVGWYQPKPTISLELIDDLELPEDARIADVGGGRSRLVDCLLEREFDRLTVLDISEAALEQSRSRLGADGETVDWVHADVLAADFDHDIDLWHDRAVFHFLTDADDRRRYVRQLDGALADDGRVILATFTTEAPERCSGLPVHRREPESFHKALGDDFELLEQREETHFTPSGVRQPYVYGLFRRA